MPTPTDKQLIASAALAAVFISACAPRPEPSFDVIERSITQLQTAMQNGRVTSRGITEQYLARIQAFDQQGPTINALMATAKAAFGARSSPSAD
jgi:hypothetical protein